MTKNYTLEYTIENLVLHILHKCVRLYSTSIALFFALFFVQHVFFIVTICIDACIQTRNTSYVYLSKLQFMLR